MDSISSRKFLKKSRKACLLICSVLLLSGVLLSCRSIKKVQAPILNEVIRIDQVYIDKKLELLIENEELPAPVYLSKSQDSYNALLLLCTHKKCGVNPSGDAFTCPCHGCQFEKTGKVINGPAEKSLLAFKTSIANDQVVIHLNQTYELPEE